MCIGQPKIMCFTHESLKPTEKSSDYIRRILNYESRMRGIPCALWLNKSLCAEKGDESKITHSDCVPRPTIPTQYKIIGTYVVIENKWPTFEIRFS